MDILEIRSSARRCTRVWFARGFRNETKMVPAPIALTSSGSEREGGLIRRTMPAPVSASAALPTTSAPASLYSVSETPDAAPAPVSTTISRPAFASASTPCGTRATLSSPRRVSFGTATFMHEPRWFWRSEGRQMVPEDSRVSRLTIVYPLGALSSEGLPVHSNRGEKLVA